MHLTEESKFMNEFTRIRCLSDDKKLSHFLKNKSELSWSTYYGYKELKKLIVS